MTVLAAAVVLVSVMCVLNLLLTFAVLRRLRKHAELLERGPGGAADLVGRTVPEFVAVTTSGASVSRGDLAGREYLIGFFSSTCGPCLEQAPEFARLAETRGDAVLSVVVGDGPGAETLGNTLAAVPTVMVGHDDPIANDFGVGGFPTMMVVDAGGTVVAASASVRSLVSSGEITHEFA